MSRFCRVICYSFENCKLVVSHWNLSDSKSSQVSRTLLSILADLNYAVVWMVSSGLLISKSSSSFINSLVTAPSAPIIISIIVTSMFHSFFSLARSRYWSFFRFLLFSICGLPERQSPLFSRLLFFCWLSLGLLVWSKLGDLFVYQNPEKFCACHFLGRIPGCAYTICSYGQI